MKRITLIFILFFLFGANVCHAAIPRLINYQGRVTDAQNTPLTGSYAITFRIYDAASSGNLLWEETHAGLVLDKGMFSVLLGSVTALNIPFDKPYFLEIKVGNEVMNPRQQIASSAYAMRAENADKLNGKTDTDFALSTDITATPTANKTVKLDANAKLPATVIPNVLGAWETKANNTVYQAATDGFVVAYAGAGPHLMIGYTDSSNPPVTVRQKGQDQGNDADDSSSSIFMPIHKNDYWKVTGAGAVFWIAIGN